jgi:NADPH2:quinone reductase
MKAVIMRKPGPPDVLEISDYPDPEISEAHQVIVKLESSGINPVDAKQRTRGTVYPAPPPHILGIDGAGTVIEKGKKVTRLQEGSRVFFMNGGIGKQPGTYAQYCVIDEAFAAIIPEGLSFAQAAAVPLAFLTAWETLFERIGLKKEEKVLIHAGAGGVGHFAVQLARMGGAHVCTTVSSPEKKTFVEKLGAEKVILYREKDFVEAVLDWTEGKGVDCAVETVGGKNISRTVSSVKNYGRIGTLLDPSAIQWSEARLKNIVLGLEMVLTPQYYDIREGRIRHRQILEDHAQYFKSSALEAAIDRAFALDEVQEAHCVLEEGHATGKYVLTVE